MMTGNKSEKGKRKRKGIIAIIPAAVFAVILIAGILYFTSEGYRFRRCLKLAEECYEAAEYEKALEYCEAAWELDDTAAEVYRLASDSYLAQDKCVEAVRVLMDKTADTEAKELAGREEYLRENIVVVARTCYTYATDGSIYKWYEYEYDEEGNLTKNAWGYGGGSVESWSEYEYDAGGNRTKEVFRTAERVIWQYEYEYDERGSLTKAVRYDSDRSVDTYWEYKYDEEENLISVSHNEEGSLYKQEEYEYNEGGNRTKYVGYYADGSISRWEEYEYDERGNMTKTIIYGPDGSVDVYREYDLEYDAGGNLMKMVEYISGNAHMWWEYDEEGNGTKYGFYNLDGSPSWWCEYEYDERGNLTKAVYHNVDGNISRNEYEYDKRGNLMKEVRYHWDGSVVEYWEYEYDLFDREIRQSGTDSSSNVYQYHYIGD